MLVLTRKPGQILSISPEMDVPPELTVRELFGAGPILIAVKRIDRLQVRLGIEAPLCLRVERLERGDIDATGRGRK
jgi:sRNA-binding carbon storage regulator CsrA